MSAIIRITAKKEGFRRAGIAHSKTATDHPEGAFTQAQLQSLQAEPNLVVEVIEQPDATPSVEARMSGKADAVVTWLADASEEARAQALKIEQAKGSKARKSVLKALGVEG